MEGCRFPTLTCDRLTGFFHRHSTGRPVFSTDMWQFIGLPCLHATGRVWLPPLKSGVVMALNATVSNITYISWRSVLLVDETKIHGENYRPVASH